MRDDFLKRREEKVYELGRVYSLSSHSKEGLWEGGKDHTYVNGTFDQRDSPTFQPNDGKGTINPCFLGDSDPEVPQKKNLRQHQPKTNQS